MLGVRLEYVLVLNIWNRHLTYATDVNMTDAYLKFEILHLSRSVIIALKITMSFSHSTIGLVKRSGFR